MMTRNFVVHVALVLASGTLFGIIARGQGAKGGWPSEQSEFNSEQADAGQPIERPVNLPPSALHVLAEDESVSGCMADENIAHDQLPGSWFIASEIHLDGADEIDMVVLPNLNLPRPPGDPGPIACFLGANAAWFWVLRNTSQGYQLVLSVGGHDLKVSQKRTNGLRNIVASTIQQAGKAAFIQDFEFDGRKYEKFSSKVVRYAP